ncbi:unnamed protein product [Haemonchus placei]|uniref:Nuclear transcription factor Y subunit beta n=1 Tax=Haemonchus placei TaxID=6290 RepID=A0A0N4W1J2_HAEPC|nr:unnamed protein product [Haemonchus placei]
MAACRMIRIVSTKDHSSLRSFKYSCRRVSRSAIRMKIVVRKHQKDQERFLPIANVARVMKRMIPSSGKIAKDAKECVQECVSEFISFITSEANDKCMSEKRKTISADDLLEAINNMGFDNYVAPLQLFLERYRAAHKLSSGFNNSNTSTRTFTVASNSSPTGIHNGMHWDKIS